MPRQYVFRTHSNGKLPVYDASEPKDTGNPWRGFYYQHSWCTINGGDIQPGENAGYEAFRGPFEGGLILLFLYTKDGKRSEFGQWTQLNSNHPTGGFTLAHVNDLGDNGNKILIYYKVCTAFDQRNRIRWQIRLSNSTPVFSQVSVRVLPPFYWRNTPNFAAGWKFYTRQYLGSRSVSFPGGATPDARDDTTHHLNPAAMAGGMAIALCSYDFERFDQNQWRTPGFLDNMTPYGGIIYSMYAPDNGTEFYRDWGWSVLWSMGVPCDGRVIPDGPVNVWVPGTESQGNGIMAMTLMILPPPPDVVTPDATKSTAQISNLFEVDDLNDNFIVRGSGTPTIS